MIPWTTSLLRTCIINLYQKTWEIRHRRVRNPTLTTQQRHAQAFGSIHGVRVWKYSYVLWARARLQDKLNIWVGHGFSFTGTTQCMSLWQQPGPTGLERRMIRRTTSLVRTKHAELKKKFNLWTALVPFVIILANGLGQAHDSLDLFTSMNICYQHTPDY